jgi:hypothetical protein
MKSKKTIPKPYNQYVVVDGGNHSEFIFGPFGDGTWRVLYSRCIIPKKDKWHKYHWPPVPYKNLKAFMKGNLIKKHRKFTQKDLKKLFADLL